MRLPDFLKVFALALLLGMASCHSGDDGGGGPYPGNPLWVQIDTQNLQTAVSTTSIDLRGTAYCGNACPTGEVAFGYCPPIDRTLPSPAIDMAWSNRTNGATGNVTHGIAGSCSCLFSYCFTSYSHAWTVLGGTPLAMDDNVIDIIASDVSGNFARDSVTITRVPVPSLRHPNGIAVDTVHNEILIASSGNSSIVAYARTDSGFAAPKRIIAGASTALGSPTSIAVDVVNDEIYVVNGGNSLVTVYPRGADGDVPPIRSITNLDTPSGIAVDTVNEELFVVTGNSSVTVLPRTADGVAVPIRSVTGLSGAGRVVLDTTNSEMFVIGGGNSILVYPLTASGPAAPVRTISGMSTGLNSARDIAVDAVNNEISVMNGNSSITVYPRTGTGDATPIRAITGGSTMLYTGQSAAIALDTTNGEIYATNGWDANYWDTFSSYFTAYVTVYPSEAGGNVAPIRTINGAYP